MTLPMPLQQSIAKLELLFLDRRPTQVTAKTVGVGLLAMLLVASCGTLGSDEAAQQTPPDATNEPSETVQTEEPSDERPGDDVSEGEAPEDEIAQDEVPDGGEEETIPNGEPSEGPSEQTPDKPSENSDSFDLLPGFYPDPATTTGSLGGTVAASSIAGTDSTPSGACEGFVNETPDHQVNLRDDFSYLVLGVESSTPASLVVVGEGGDSWCASGSNPSVEQESWPQGSYDVYVGNPAAPEAGDPYQLNISEINPNFGEFGSAPFQEGPPGQGFDGGDYQPISVAPGFEPDPAIGTGNLGGPLLASDVTGSVETETGECSGYIDTQADHFVTLEQGFRYLKIQAESASPTSLVIVGPQGEAWCYTGNNPYIEGVWDPGDYEVYLANLDAAEVGDRYELLVTEID